VQPRNFLNINFAEAKRTIGLFSKAALSVMFAGSSVLAHEVDQRFGRYVSSDGESRVMSRFLGTVEAPPFADGQGSLSLSISAQSESIESQDNYTQKNFENARRTDQLLGVDGTFTFAKRSELVVGASQGQDSVTKTNTGKLGFGQWFLGDQLRVGLLGLASKTSRPADSFLDYDSTTINILPQVNSSVANVNVKAILNPKTTVSADYSLAQSTDRPLLRAWAVGVKQYFDACECAVHGDAARVINIGRLNTNMSAGELTGTQFSVAYLQSLWEKAHGRLSYRYAREDEFTRAYEDHLVFGADSYVASLSQEFERVQVAGGERNVLVDVAATRYLHNKAGSATTFEFGGSVKF
jgi:hypothetical protein